MTENLKIKKNVKGKNPLVTAVEQRSGAIVSGGHVPGEAVGGTPTAAGGTPALPETGERQKAPGVHQLQLHPQRAATLTRKTTETDISVSLKIDGTGRSRIHTGAPFFDHMLTLFAKHATVDLDLQCDGDLEVDTHHTVEDCGIALGQAFLQALGDKKGIRRYGAGFDPRNPFVGEAYVPMDECLARCVIDFSGRPHLVWRGLDKAAHRKISLADRQQDASSSFRFGLAREFFQAFANEGRCNLHLDLLYGDEPHHIVEALFKAFARAVDAACQRDPRIPSQLPSTKGKL